jgi:hypothetical protein
MAEPNTESETNRLVLASDIEQQSQYLQSKSFGQSNPKEKRIMFHTQKHPRRFLSLSFLTILSAVAMAAPQTFVGTVTDSMCGAKHMLPGKTDAECTHECIKANSKYALVADKKIYTLTGSQQELSRLAGRHVRLTGEKNGDTINVQSIAELAK